MRYARLFLTMVRYRSTLTLVTFLLLGAAWGRPLTSLSLQLALCAIALACTYACATSLNDLADFELDRLNLQGHHDRPLLTAQGSRRDVALVAIGAAGLALAAGFAAGPLPGTLIVLGLVMFAQYSLPPLRISHRAHITPVYLALGYTSIPYVMGASVAGGHLRGNDLLVMAGLLLVFVARIILKDLRDRAGDAAGGKPTLVLLHGKTVTCGISIAALCAGVAVLGVSLRGTPLLALVLVPYFAGLLITEVRLLRTTDIVGEVIAVGVGARLGSGLMLTLLGIFLLRAQNADAGAVTGLALVIITAYARMFVAYLRHPGSFTFGDRSIHDAMHRALGVLSRAARAA